MDGEREYIIFHDFGERLPEGHSPDAWPIHITMASWFVLDRTTHVEMVDTVRSIASSCKPFLYKAGETAMFGVNHDIPVTTLVDLESMLAELHTTLMDDLGKIGCRFVTTDMNWESDLYTPHISHKPDYAIPTASQEFNDLTIASRLIDGHGIKAIDAVLQLG